MKVFPEQLNPSLYISRCLSAFCIIKEMGLRNFLTGCIFLGVFVCLCPTIYRNLAAYGSMYTALCQLWVWHLQKFADWTWCSVEDIICNENGLPLTFNGHNYLSVVLPCQISQFIGQWRGNLQSFLFCLVPGSPRGCYLVRISSFHIRQEDIAGVPTHPQRWFWFDILHLELCVYSKIVLHLYTA